MNAPRVRVLLERAGASLWTDSRDVWDYALAQSASVSGFFDPKCSKGVVRFDSYDALRAAYWAVYHRFTPLAPSQLGDDQWPR